MATILNLPAVSKFTVNVLARNLAGNSPPLTIQINPQTSGTFIQWGKFAIFVIYLHSLTNHACSIFPLEFQSGSKLLKEKQYAKMNSSLIGSN